LTPAATPETSYYDKELAKLQKEMDMQGVALEEQISKYQEIRNKLESAKRQIISDAVPEEFKKKITAELKMSGDDIDSALSETEVKLYQLIEQQAIETYDNLMKKDKEQLKYKKININTALEDYKRMYKKIENDDRLSLDTRKQLMEQYSSEIKRLEYQRDAEISNLDQQLLDNQKQLIDDGLNVRLMSIEEEREAVKASYTEQIQDQDKLKKKLEEVDELYDKLRDNALKDYDDNTITYGELNNLEKGFTKIGYSIEKARANFQTFHDGLVNGLTDAIAKGESLSETLKNVAQNLAAMFAQKGAELLVNSLLQSMGFGGGKKGDFSAGDGINYDSLAVAHTGGYIAADGIETFHTGGVVGLKADEKLIKARVGEMVLTEQHQKNLANNVNGGGKTEVHNHFNIQAVDSKSFVDLVARNPEAITNTVTQDIVRNGQTRQAIKQYGR